MQDINDIKDKYLKSLILADGLMSPSASFTNKVMEKISPSHELVKESSQFIGKNVTLLLFLLVGFINLLFFYLIWPYLTVWIPENSFFIFLITNIKIFVQTYLISMIQRSASISLLMIIVLGVITILGNDTRFQSFRKRTKRFNI